MNKDIEEYFSTSESKAVKVLIWLLNNRDDSSRIHGTLDMIALDSGVNRVTINRVFQSLYKTGFLEREHNGCYRLKRL